ncbi:MAG: hypothetical protein A4E65_01976 [Syntrophorhabdus sp. PtaU1.Bin153]|nr:MAG: hypothetical protein A4E65_01976 [Syntrophorhabdus sp. PtaU1.Bin153]
MYFDPVFNVSVLDDGTFSIEMSLQKQQEEKDKSGKVIDAWPKTVRKTVTAKDTEEVKKLLDRYLPVLAKRESKNANEFDKAFEEASAKAGK